MRISDWSSDVCSSDLSRDDVFEVVAQKFAIRPDHRYIISVGSVGQPRDYDNRASYAVYDTEEKVFEFKRRSEEHTSELQSLMRNSYAVFCLKKKKHSQPTTLTHTAADQELTPA